MVADKIIASAQRDDPDSTVVKIDLEATHDAVWSEKLGVDNDRLLVVNPETGESALDMADALIHTKEVSLIVVDSLAQLVPAKEIEASAEDQFIGLQARLISSFVRKAVAGLSAEKLRGHDLALLFINQFRVKIGGYAPHGMDPLTEPGGKSLGFAYSLEITIKNKESKGKDAFDVETIVSNEHAFSIVKNKLNSGPREGEFVLCREPNEDLGLGIGDIDDASTLLAYAKKFGAYYGGGQKWTLSFWDEEHTFSKVSEAIVRLYAEPELYWKLRNFLICEQASHLGMPDSFLERFYP
jgi:recombination protein RecA